MGNHRPLRLVLVLLILCFSLVLTVFAEGFTDYSTTPVLPQEMTGFLSRINFQRTDDISKDQMIHSFAISRQGKIALAVETKANAQIGVFDSDGSFLYGYCFINNGSAFTVFFEGELLSINWAKSGYIGCFDNQGNCVHFGRDDGDRKNSDLFHSQRSRPRSGTVGSLTYHTEGPWLTWLSWRFVIEDNAGNQTVIYDASRTQSVRWPLGVAGFVGFFAVLVYWRNKQEKNK